MRYMTLVTNPQMLQITDKDAMASRRLMQIALCYQHGTVLHTAPLLTCAVGDKQSQFVSQASTHAIVAHDNALCLATDCSALVMAQISHRPAIAEAWVRLQDNFYVNRGNHSSTGAGCSQSTSVVHQLSAPSTLRNFSNSQRRWTSTQLQPDSAHLRTSMSVTFTRF